MPRRGPLAAWALAAGTLALLALSLTGDGVGFGGLAFHMAWSYALVVGALVSVLLVAKGRRDEPASPRPGPAADPRRPA